MKKFIAIIFIMICLLNVVSCSGKIIGKISGAENEYITIDDERYVLSTDTDYSIADKGKYLGKATNSKITMRVYSVKGDTDREYIYTFWDWEGAFYKREEP